MMHNYFLEALGISLKDIMQIVDRAILHRPFGGKALFISSDLRQILPDIPKGSRQDIVFRPYSSYLWDSCEVLKLHAI